MVKDSHFIHLGHRNYFHGIGFKWWLKVNHYTLNHTQKLFIA